MNAIYYSWAKIDEMVDELAGQITNSPVKVNHIYGVLRGGLIPSVLLSHKLNIPMTTSWLPNTLIVDDIADSGATLKTLKMNAILNNYLTPPSTAVLFRRYSTGFEPDFYGETLDNDSWIVYPWENHEKTEEEYKTYRAKREREPIAEDAPKNFPRILPFIPQKSHLKPKTT